MKEIPAKLTLDDCLIHSIYGVKKTYVSRIEALLHQDEPTNQEITVTDVKKDQNLLKKN